MLEVSREEITEGSLTRALVVLAAPLVAQNLVQVVQQVVDTFWLGQLGENEVAAVGLNFPVLAVIFSVVIGTFVGTQVLVSQRVGSDDTHGARRAVFHGVLIALAAGIILGALVYAGASSIISLFGPEQGEVTELAAIYLSTVMLGLPAMAMSDSLEAGFVGWGYTRAALYINIATVAANVVLDPFLIFGWWVFPKLGVEGAALATAAGYAAGFLLALGLTLRGWGGFTLTRADTVFELDDIREIVDIGMPNVGQHLASQSVRLVIVAIVSMVGGAAGLAAYTVGARIASVAFIPAGGLQQAAQSVIGQNLGADQPARAERATWVGVAIAVGGLSIVGAIQWLVPVALTTAFVPGISDRGLEFTVDYLRILAYGYWAIGASYLFMAGFNGARRTGTSMIASLFQYWGIRLPIAIGGAFVLGMGVHAIFWAVTISNVLAAAGLGAYYWYTANDGMLDRAAATAAASTASD